MFASTRSFWIITALTVLLTPAGCSKTSQSPLQLARQLHHDADWAATIEQCTVHLLTTPDDTEALTMRGQSYLALGQLDDALADLNRVVTLAPEDPDPLYLRSMIYRKMGEDELAVADRDRALHRDPTYEAAYEYSPANFARPLDIDLKPQSEQPEEVVAAEPDEDEPYQLDDVYAAEEPAEPYGEDRPSPDDVADSTEGGPRNPETTVSRDGPGIRSLLGPRPNQTATVAAPQEEAGEKAEAEPEAGRDVAADQPTRPRYQRTPQTLSTALPPVPAPTARPGSPGNAPALVAQPRSTGIQSNATPRSTGVNPPSHQLLGIPLGNPILGYPQAASPPTGYGTTPGTAAANPSQLRAPFVPAPTGRGQANQPVQTSTALPTQLAPASPYALHANPIPGQQTQPTLSTSIQPQTSSTPAGPPATLSTARPVAPQGSGS